MRSTKNKLLTIFCLIILVLLGVAAVKPPEGKFKNLQILPKDISEEKLDSIMKSYNVALGVNCKFCHENMKYIPDSLDYASDVPPRKKDARKMMRMVVAINTSNFYFDTNERPEYLRVVHCNTCHRGESFPED